MTGERRVRFVDASPPWTLASCLPLFLGPAGSIPSLFLLLACVRSQCRFHTFRDGASLGTPTLMIYSLRSWPSRPTPLVASRRGWGLTIWGHRNQELVLLSKRKSESEGHVRHITKHRKIKGALPREDGLVGAKSSGEAKMGGREARRRCLMVNRGELSLMSWLKVLTKFEDMASKSENAGKKNPVPSLSGDGTGSSVRASER